MAEEPIAILRMLAERAKVATICFDIASYSIRISKKGLTLLMPGKVDQRGYRDKIRVGPHNLHDLPFTLEFMHGVDNLDKDEFIGQFQYFEASDVLGKTPAQVCGSFYVAPKLLDQVLSLLSSGVGPWQVVITISGLKTDADGKQCWDNGDRLLLVKDVLFLRQDHPMPGLQQSASEASLMRVEKRLEEIERQLVRGVKVKLF